jgi:hypothetical protein
MEDSGDPIRRHLLVRRRSARANDDRQPGDRIGNDARGIIGVRGRDLDRSGRGCGKEFGINLTFVSRFTRAGRSASQQIADNLRDTAAFAGGAELQFEYEMLRQFESPAHALIVPAGARAVKMVQSQLPAERPVQQRLLQLGERGELALVEGFEALDFAFQFTIPGQEIRMAPFPFRY